MKVLRFRIRKRARIYTSMFACLAFLALAVWGWDLPIETVFVFLILCIGFLVLIIAGAALLGFLINLLRKSREKKQEEQDGERPFE